MDGSQTREFEVNVTYNGLTKPFKVTLVELISALLAQAIRVFGITNGTHLFSLFTDKNKPLPDNETVAAAHLHPHEQLSLRPDAVKAG